MNQITRKTVAVIGVMLGIAGFNHGFFEALQGWKPTEGLIIRAIAEDQFRYIQGSEEAFTIIPNFLITGILAMLVSLGIMVWSVKFLDRRKGPAVFLMLFILLFLVGGGIGQIIFFLPAWGAATRINADLSWWKKTLPAGLQNILARIRPFTLFGAVACFLIALGFAIVWNLPGAESEEQLFLVTWSFLGLGWLLMMMISFLAGFAADLKQKRELNV